MKEYPLSSNNHVCPNCGESFGIYTELSEKVTSKRNLQPGTRMLQRFPEPPIFVPPNKMLVHDLEYKIREEFGDDTLYIQGSLGGLYMLAMVNRPEEHT